MITAKDAVFVQETGAGRFQVRASTGVHELLIDEPAAYGGLDSGPNPFDLLCTALGSCTLITMRFYAERKGWDLGPFRVRVTHHKNSPDARDRFERVLFLGDVTADQQQRLQQIADRCPVHLLVERGADVATSIVSGSLDGAYTDALHAKVLDKLCKEEA